ncbi:hypothetical protein JTM39_00005, partial [Pseudomonas aeruginosa]|nr:hypothetical protein [Pseudomonas aeruginosa]
RLKPWAWPIWMVARSSTLSSVYDIGAAPYRKGQVLHSVFAAAHRISACIRDMGGLVELHGDWFATNDRNSQC